MKIQRIAITPIVSLITVIVAQALNLAIGYQPWKGEVLLSVTWVWTAYFLCGPVITTVAAWDGAKLFNRESGAVWNLSNIRFQLMRRWCLSSLVGAILPTLVVLVWMAFYFRIIPQDVIASSLATVVSGVATVFVLLCGGLSLGLALGKVYGPLAAFALALGLQLTSYLGSTPIFMVGGVSDSLLGLRLSSEAITFQFCGLAALIIVELFFIGGQTYFRKYRSAVSLVCLCLAVIVSSAPMFVQFPRFVNVSDFADGSECLYLDNSARINKDGRVCISLQHDHKLPEIISAWTQIQQKVRDAGIDNFPNKLYELPPGAGPDDGQLLQSGETATFTLTADKLDFTEKQTISVQWLADSIAVPTWCSGLWADEPPSENFYALQDTARQLLQRIVDPVAAKSLSAEDIASFQANWNDLLQCKGLSQ